MTVHSDDDGPDGKLSDDIFALRASEYATLDEQGHVYLDYTGANVCPRSLMREHLELIGSNVLGNPHSINPSSRACTDLVERTRQDVLRFFNASPSEYACIFTANATAALRLVGEAFPFAEGGQYTLLADNHNSVNGISVFALHHGSRVTCVPTGPSLRIDDAVLNEALSSVAGDGTQPKLFAYPAQSNYSGAKHSLEWVARAQKLGWMVLLDVAAYVPTSPLDLSAVHPDFAVMSFYKMMGYPTGVGALLVRHEAMKKLRRPWFSGGTIEYVNVLKNKHVLRRNHEAFEDGTVNFLSIPAVSIGLRFLSSVGMSRLAEHVQALTKLLLQRMKSLRHSNGAPLVIVFGPQSASQRGGTITFDVIDPSGEIVPPRLIEPLANRRRISLRSGCFCNHGSAAMAFPDAWTAPDSTGPEAMEIIKNSAAMRASIGIATSLSDIDAFIDFLKTFANTSVGSISERVQSPHQVPSSGLGAKIRDAIRNVFSMGCTDASNEAVSPHKPAHSATSVQKARRHRRHTN